MRSSYFDYSYTVTRHKNWGGEWFNVRVYETFVGNARPSRPVLIYLDTLIPGEAEAHHLGAAYCLAECQERSQFT